ncbi:MAG: ABC transporter permease [Anaerorhabdus sp.]|uniref:ABC transporter permease n=1 Tax=Anaerorhabdus sp. TaxID=1872524 RepID=UPI003A88DB5D
MTALLSNIALQWKLNLRDKEIITVYYIVPLVFYLFMSGIFKTIMPGMDQTIIPTMCVFGATMGAMLGSPAPLIAVFATDIKKSYLVGGVPLYSALIVNFVSAFIHIFIMSCIIVFTAPIFFNATLPTNLTFWIGLILFIFASLSISSIFGLYVKDSSEASMLGQCIFLPTVMLSGIMIPSSMLPSIFTTFAKILPGTWGFELMISNELTMQPILFLVVISIAGLIICFGKTLKSN